MNLEMIDGTYTLRVRHMLRSNPISLAKVPHLRRWW